MYHLVQLLDRKVGADGIALYIFVPNSTYKGACMRMVLRVTVMLVLTSVLLVSLVLYALHAVVCAFII